MSIQSFTGRVDFLDANGNVIIAIDPNAGLLIVRAGADLVVGDSSNREIFHLRSSNATFEVGATGNEGDIILKDGAGREVFHLNSSSAALHIGAVGNGGDIILRDGAGQEVFRFYSRNATLEVGANGKEGDLILRDGAGREVFHLNGSNATLQIGANGNEGDLILRDGAGREVFHLNGSNATLEVGANGNEGDIIVRDVSGVETIHLNGGSGDIILSNADAAEHFDLAESVSATPGMLMVLNDQGRLEPSSQPYDSKVVGVVAGAGHYRPGIVLNHRDAPLVCVPISVLGKVSCKADAAYGPIEVGNLLTTSPTLGHAMKVSDRSRAFGSVIGKALTPLREGVGYVDVLITLQ